MNSSWVFGESDFTSNSNNGYIYPGMDGAYDITYDPYNNTIWVQASYELYSWELTDLIGGKSLSDSVKAPNTGSGLFNESITNEITVLAFTAILVAAVLFSLYRYRINKITK